MMMLAMITDGTIGEGRPVKIVSHIERLVMILIMLYIAFQLACSRLRLTTEPSDPLIRRLEAGRERRTGERERQRQREELQNILKNCEGELDRQFKLLDALNADPHASAQDRMENEKKIRVCQKIQALNQRKLAAL